MAIFPTAGVPSGVPQGSVLSPLLFSIYINDLLESSFTNKRICYGDDLKIYGPPSSAFDSDLLILSDWLDKNFMSVNIDKCEVIHFVKHNPLYTYNYRNIALKTIEEFRDLSILVDHSLCLQSHAR